ncbi:MAG: hypothetical protein LIO62_02705 [Clostridiales bacterium]|nr:hypothetical protein [Clostridiales bacterium]
MKKPIITYIILFALSLIIPSIVCFATGGNTSSEELSTIFRQCISLIQYFH